MSEIKSNRIAWGRLVLAGGTDFATLGRKDKGGKNAVNEDRPELASMHIMRNVANIKFKRVITSHSGCHVVALDIDNQAWIFGRNEHHQLSFPLPSKYTSPHLAADGEPSTTPAAPFPFLLNNLADNRVPLALKAQGIVEAAVGRGHTILVTDKGEAWSAGWNNLGQCGHSNNSEHISTFTKIAGLLTNEIVIAASAGVNFSVFLCKSGRVYTVGSGQNGQLGNGKTGEYIAASKVFFTEQSEPYLVRGAIEGKQIVSIACGQQHSLALDNEGFAYAWGFGGLGRLGLGVQADALVPVVIPNFAGPNALTRCRKLTAGSSNSLFIDAQGMVSLCGKWKTSGDGSSGQPWMHPKLVQEIMGYKWTNISAGGVTLFATTYDNKENDFAVGWGQGAGYGELGMGAGSVKSATKPTRIDNLDNITILDIAAGQNTTFLIARPPPTPTELASLAAEAIPIPVSTEDPTSSLAISAIPSTSSGIDLSGFGFSFGPPPPAIKKVEEKIGKILDQGGYEVSRTETSVWEELGRYPIEVEVIGEACRVCGDEEKEEESLECEMCENAFHPLCLTPPMMSIPEGEWFCSNCESSNDRLDANEVNIVEADVSSKKRKAPVMQKQNSATGLKGKKKKA